MRKNRSVAIVTKAVETYENDPPKQIRELKRLVREGNRSGDFMMVGAAYCCLAEAYRASDDLNEILSNSLKAVALLKDTDEYEIIARAYITLGAAYTYQGNNQMVLLNDELVYDIVRKHRIKGNIKLSILNNLSVSYHDMGEIKRRSCSTVPLCSKFPRNSLRAQRRKSKRSAQYSLISTSSRNATIPTVMPEVTRS